MYIGVDFLGFVCVFLSLRVIIGLFFYKLLLFFLMKYWLLKLKIELKLKIIKVVFVLKVCYFDDVL